MIRGRIRPCERGGERGEGAVVYPVLGAARLGGDRHGWRAWRSGADGEDAWVGMGDGERRGEEEFGIVGRIWEWGILRFGRRTQPTVESLAALSLSLPAESPPLDRCTGCPCRSRAGRQGREPFGVSGLAGVEVGLDRGSQAEAEVSEAELDDGLRRLKYWAIGA